MLAFIRNNLRWLAGGFTLTLFSSFGQTFFIAASVGEWRAAFDMSHGEFGRLYMIATLASALCLPFLGKMVDVLPEHRTVLIVVPALAVATLAAAFAPTIIMLTVAIFLLRLFGQGMMTHIALTATGRWFVARRGRAVSLVVLGHQGGEATLPLLFAAISVAFGYQMGWVAGAIVLIAVALPITYLTYRQPRDPRGKEMNEVDVAAVRDWTRNEVLRDPLFWVLLLGVLAPPFIGTTIFYHQDYLGSLNGWQPQTFALSLSVMAATTVACALIAGWAIDRFEARNVLPFFLAPLALACTVLSLGGAAITLFATMILLGIAYGISSTLFGAIWPEIYGAAHLGAIRSVIVAAMVLATAIGPGLTGTLIDLGVGLPTQLRMLAGYCLMMVVTMVMVSRVLRARKAAPLSAALPE